MSITHHVYKAVAVVAFALLTACGAVDEPDLYYDNTSLYLNSVEYKRESAKGSISIVPGEVIVQFDEGKQEEQQKRLTDLGLQTRTGGTVFLVTTRAGFESQLARALMDQKIVRLALPNAILIPT